MRMKGTAARKRNKQPILIVMGEAQARPPLPPEAAEESPGSAEHDAG